MFILYIFVVLIIISSIQTNKYFYYKEYSAIVNFLPNLKLHDVVIIYSNKKNGIFTIDFTPNQDNTNMLINFLLGQNVPAHIRIRKLNSWDLEKWYKIKPISINQIYDYKLRKNFLNIQKNWKNKEMNLYEYNCKHFSNFVINYLSSLDSFLYKDN